MKKRLIYVLWLNTFFLLLVILSFFFTPISYAVEDPLSRPNNFMGIHILFPSELDQAKDLVNSNGGDWGYVTIPIQIGDRDLEKWQEFMDKARLLHVIPLVRLATQNDPHNTSVWRKPTSYDILDFANFLSSLSWPTKNKYVILFNEVNRFDEWGGDYPSPIEYADTVSYAYEQFKKRDQNFYLILSGMDAAAPNDYKKYISGLTYLEDMVAGSNVVREIDGFSSHSYPNPAFSAPPSETKEVSVATYRHEYDLLNENAPKKLPVFITETGWSTQNLSETTISKYYKTTFSQIWNKDKDKIVAITPFLLNSNGGFDQFAFFKNGNQTDFLKTLATQAKTKGKPVVSKLIKTESTKQEKDLVGESFSSILKNKKLVISPYVSMYFKTIFGLN